MLSLWIRKSKSYEVMDTAGSKLKKALGDLFLQAERYFGLENLGNTCCCNSVLHVSSSFFHSYFFHCTGDGDDKDCQEQIEECLHFLQIRFSDTCGKRDFPSCLKLSCVSPRGLRIIKEGDDYYLMHESVIQRHLGRSKPETGEMLDSAETSRNGNEPCTAHAVLPHKLAEYLGLDSSLIYVMLSIEKKMGMFS